MWFVESAGTNQIRTINGPFKFFYRPVHRPKLILGVCTSNYLLQFSGCSFFVGRCHGREAFGDPLADREVSADTDGIGLLLTVRQVAMLRALQLTFKTLDKEDEGESTEELGAM